MEELKNSEDYFPYIGHELDLKYRDHDPNYNQLIGTLFKKENVVQKDEDTMIINENGSNSVFKTVKIKGMKAQRELAADSSCAEVVVPSHRTLFDYCIGQPVHSSFVNSNVMLIAGNNLFVSRFGFTLRKFGGVMFLREDVMLKRKGLAPAYLSQKRYLNEVFPAYIKQQMFNGVGDERTKMDMILYAEQEKDPATNKRSGGRTKTGHLRNLSYIIFDKLKSITKDSDTTLYVTPVNVSFSKYAEAPFIVHPVASKGLFKGLRYILEQVFVFRSYTGFAHVNMDAKLDVTVHYGKPEILHSSDFSSTSDLLRYSHSLKDKIGLLETIYPTTMLFRALDTDSDISMSDLNERLKVLYERYVELGIDVENVSDKNGNLRLAEELSEGAVRTINKNPNFYISGVKSNRLLSIRSGRLISHDLKLQTWYGNTIRHLDHPSHTNGKV